MKTSKIFLAAAFAGAALFTSCKVNDSIKDRNDASEVKFTSGITASQTRVGIDQGNSVWEIGDPIGIYMVANGTTDIAEGVTNIPYKANTATVSTSFIPSGTTTIYYPVTAPAKVDFIAYHPYSASVSSWVYPVSVATQTSQTAIDLMWAIADNKGTGFDKTNKSGVDFTFEHKLVKLVMNVTKGTGVTGDITSVKINGMNTKANFDLKGNDGLTITESVLGITPYTATAGSKYEAILLPLDELETAHTVEFTIGSDTYTWKMSNEINSLEAGSIYTYTITLTKYEVTATGSISNWTVGSSGSGKAD